MIVLLIQCICLIYDNLFINCFTLSQTEISSNKLGKKMMIEENDEMYHMFKSILFRKICLNFYFIVGCALYQICVCVRVCFEDFNEMTKRAQTEGKSVLSLLPCYYIHFTGIFIQILFFICSLLYFCL